jgi:hypothetical protein
MPPPPLPFAHRRSQRLINPTSPPASLGLEDQKPCLLKMSLAKGATFHHSSSSSSEEDPALSIPHLSRRSPTCSSALLASWLSDRQDVAQSIADFEETFAGARGKRGSARRRSAQEFEQQVIRVHRASLPADEGLGSSVSSTSDKELSQKFERALDLFSDKDSGLGSSISDQESVGARISEDDGVTKELMKGWLYRCLLMCSLIDQPFTDADSIATIRQTRQRTRGNQASSAVIQSLALPTPRKGKKHPPISKAGRKKITQHIINPILGEERFSDFHPLVSSLGSKTNKAIRCLRDLEQSLIFQPLVSFLLSSTSTGSDPDSSKTLSISQHLYRTFSEFSIQLVIDTYNQLSESDQRREADRPYDNGYFLDLVQQVHRLAAQVGRRRRNSTTSATEEDDDVSTPSELGEVTLEGGLGSTGDIAELVRWKDGKGTSLRTGQPYEPTPGIKREASSMLDDDASRSMARRKKGYIHIPEITKCSFDGCDKEFTRKCDLSKHEKTHSRPFKCPEESCKYHTLGLPTEKERDRHHNDKHSDNPHYYKCDFCEFRTKRESNCKQHMEKKHGWNYERAKGRDKGQRLTPAQTPQTPSMEYSSSMQSPAMSYGGSHWDDGSSIAGSIAGSAQLTPYDQPMSSFDGYGQNSYAAPIFPRNNQSAGYNGFDFNQPLNQQYMSPNSSHQMTPVTPAWSEITGQSPYLNNVEMNMDYNYNTMPTPESLMQPRSRDPSMNALPTPDSFMQSASRHPSISNQSPMFETGNGMMAAPMLGSMDMPEDDFQLLNGDNISPFTNSAAATATLFPAVTQGAQDTQFSASNFAVLDNDILFNDEGFVDYDMNN